MRPEKRNILGNCPLCGREMVDGNSVNEHHLLPKSLKGRETVMLHRICHSKIHSVFTERELYNHFHTMDRLLEHEEIQKFIKWVANKDPEFKAKNVATKAKRRRR